MDDFIENNVKEKVLMVGGNDGAGKALALALYDAQAVQKVPVWLDEDEQTEPIILTFEPLSDERFISFAETSGLKIVNDGNALERHTAEPLGKLWNELVSDAEGVEFEGGRPENWKDFFDLLQFKIPTMNKYLAVAVYEKAQTKGGKLVFGASNERLLYADLYFNGEVVTTTHYLQKSNFEFAKELEKAARIPFAKTKGLQTVGDYALPNTVKGKALLYDKYQTKDAEGFVGGVPIRVKSDIIDYLVRNVVKEKK
jgi:hypothetical protein